MTDRTRQIVIHNKPDFVDRVQKHIDKPTRYPLSDEDQERLAVVNFVHELRENIRTRAQIVNAVKLRFPALAKSRNAIYSIITECEEIYGKQKVDTEYFRGIILDLQLKTIQKAQIQNDQRAVNDGIKNLIKILGLDKDSTDIPPFEQYANQVFIMNVQVNGDVIPVVLSLADKLDEETKQTLLDAQDISFEEITKKPGESQGD